MYPCQKTLKAQRSTTFLNDTFGQLLKSWMGGRTCRYEAHVCVPDKPGLDIFKLILNIFRKPCQRRALSSTSMLTLHGAWVFRSMVAGKSSEIDICL